MMDWWAAHKDEVYCAIVLLPIAGLLLWWEWRTLRKVHDASREKR